MNNSKVKVTTYWRKPYTMRLAPTRWQMLKLRIRQFITILKWSMLGLTAVIIAGAFIGANFFSSTTVVNAETQVQVPTEMKAPVLDRIATCESGGKQFRQNGSLVTNTNTNGTVDVGKYQINMSAEHIQEMAKLNFNPLTEEGNTAYAKYLYANRGTGDWASSQACWKR